MTVKEYLSKNKVEEFVLTDRVRVPIDNDVIKYLNLEGMNVASTEIKKGILHIYTDYVADAC